MATRMISIRIPQADVILSKELNFQWVGRDVRNFVSETISVNDGAFYLLRSGRILHDEDVVQSGDLECVFKILGGKGGFGSMLRAIGAQIEKTTNREACRDLSGRRLRDINEEKRLKKWIAEQADREKEKAEKKKKKLEKMCAEPKHEFVNPEYDKVRSEMVEKVFDAVEQGVKASCEPSSSGVKRKTESTSKGCLWIDEGLSGASETDESDSDCEPTVKKIKLNNSSLDIVSNSEPSCSTSVQG